LLADGDLIAKQGDPLEQAVVLVSGCIAMRNGRTKKGEKICTIASGRVIWQQGLLDVSEMLPVTLTADGGNCKVALISRDKYPGLSSAVRAAEALALTLAGGEQKPPPHKKVAGTVYAGRRSLDTSSMVQDRASKSPIASVFSRTYSAPADMEGSTSPGGGPLTRGWAHA
jgi:hypothetical protein